ncbi:atpF [Symbiodinium microadriaticum]|nr:atpF [Symbiodinium microadriaticum]
MDCLGGKGRKSMILSPRAAVQGQFTWEVQKGTKDLFVEVLCEPMASSEGSAKLSAECKGEDGKALLTILGDDDDDGLLNHQVRKAHTHGAEWSWSGNPESKNGSSTLWLRVKGTLHCDVSFSLENDYVANMATDLRYKWSGIDPCPQQLKGCAPCPDDKCHEDDVAQCDGSSYWECFPKTLLAKATATTSIPILPPEGAPGPPSTSIDKSATAESHPPLSFEDILADPQLRAILRAQQSDEPSLPFERPVPTSHPAEAAPSFAGPFGAFSLVSREATSLHLEAMARRVLSFAVLAVLVIALRWSATAFLPAGKPLLRGGAAGALATTAAAAGAMPALAEEEGGLLNFGKVELGGGFALNLNIPDINLVNISILVAGLFYFLGPLLSESMASREKEIQSDIDDAVAKYNEASTRLAEAKKAKEQADAVVKEINDSIAKDIKEFQDTLNAQATKSQEAQDKALESSLKDMESRSAANLEKYVDAAAVRRGLVDLQNLSQKQKTQFMDVTLLQSDKTALDQTQLSPRLRGGVGDQNRRMHDGSAVMLAALVSCFIIGLALCTGARSTSTRHSGTAPEGLQQQQSEVRAQLGAAIQGRRTMYHLVQDGSLPSSPTAEAGP